MGISTNSIGNYVSFNYNNVNNTNAVKSTENVRSEGITADEKNYFASKYPQNRQEIMDYHFYGNTGKMSGITVGTIINRRG